MPRTRFFLITSIVMLACVLFAFGPTFYFRAADTPDQTGAPNMPWYLYVHGTALSLWILLPVAQTGLVAAKRTDLHRKLGIAGLVIAALVVATCIPTVLLSVPRFHRTPGGPDAAAVSNIVLGDLVSMVFFPLMLLMGYLRRNEPEAHRRWMLLATTVIWGPVLGRFITVWGMPVLAGVFAPPVWIGALMVHDWWTLRRVHRATLAATATVVGSFATAFLIGLIPAARAFVQNLDPS